MISDTLATVASTHGMGQGISKFLLNRHQSSFTSNPSSDQCGGTLQISAGFPIDAVAPPPVRSNHVKTLPRRLIKKRRRTRRKTLKGADGNDDDGEEFFAFSGDGGDVGGPFDNNNNNWGGGSGKGWNFGGFGGSDWGDSSSNNSYHDPAFDFVYEVLSWIVFSNCLHFAFKKVVRIVSDGLGDPARGKVPIRLAPVC